MPILLFGNYHLNGQITFIFRDKGKNHSVQRVNNASLNSDLYSIDISDEASRSVVWSQGTFSALVFKTLQLEMEDVGNAEVTCEYSLNKTPYKEVRWQRIPRRPNVFHGKSKSLVPKSTAWLIVMLFAINFYL